MRSLFHKKLKYIRSRTLNYMEGHIKEVVKDQERLEKLTLKLDVNKEAIYFDFSKTHVTCDQVRKYYEKFNAKDIYKKIKGMFDGEKLNYTENRKVLHVALRDHDVLRKLEDSTIKLDGEKKLVYSELVKIRHFITNFDNGMKGVTGENIDTIVNIGIGGSDLGPRMVCDGLSYYGRPGIKVFFISNIDAIETIRVFKQIIVAKTLFIVVSKTFTTVETLKNAELAFKYASKELKRDGKEIYEKHFVAVSSNEEKVSEMNIKWIFTMWDFVGGRYSLWSAVGLSIALYVGFDNYVKLLKGASMADEEFRRNKGCDNLPILHAIVELFYSENGYNNKCIVPYDQCLEKFYSYLQQSEMESNGKASDEQDTGLIIWGGIGTNSQHSFFQLLHQGTRKILTEFLLPLKPLHDEKVHHDLIISNCLAQSKALMEGKESSHMYDNFEGDRPSITICYSKLTPLTLGALIAHYEHKIFVQGIYWGINSFDQFGVTLGKKIATDICNILKSGRRGEGLDLSTEKVLDILEKVAE